MLLPLRRKSDTVTLRLLNENKDNVTAWILKDGNWEEVETFARGKYVVLKSQGTESTVCLKYTERGFNFIWVIFALLIMGTIVFIFIKKDIKNSHIFKYTKDLCCI